MKIGEMVKRNVLNIVEYCNNVDQNELNNLLDLRYSKNVFGVNYPFFIELSNINNADSKREERRFYKDIYSVCNKRVKLTSQWYDYQKENFQQYIDKIKNKISGNEAGNEEKNEQNNTGVLFEELNEENNYEITNFTYERDLQNSLISQAEYLFPGYKIFGKNEGIEYIIEGKRIDLLLENKEENTFLAIELKAGEADLKVFGQISMYIGLLKRKFPDKKIKGCIIAGEIDETLKYACSTNENIVLHEYQMKISIVEIKL